MALSSVPFSLHLHSKHDSTKEHSKCGADWLANTIWQAAGIWLVKNN